MKLNFLILIVAGFAFSSCTKDEKSSSNLQEISAPSPALDRGGDYNLQVIGGPGTTESLTCGWSDGFGSGQVGCAGDHCTLSTMTLPTGGTATGITCWNGTVPLHTDNYR